MASDDDSCVGAAVTSERTLLRTLATAASTSSSVGPSRPNRRSSSWPAARAASQASALGAALKQTAWPPSRSVTVMPARSRVLEPLVSWVSRAFRADCQTWRRLLRRRLAASVVAGGEPGRTLQADSPLAICGVAITRASRPRPASMSPSAARAGGGPLPVQLPKALAISASMASGAMSPTITTQAVSGRYHRAWKASKVCGVIALRLASVPMGSRRVLRRRGATKLVTWSRTRAPGSSRASFSASTTPRSRSMAAGSKVIPSATSRSQRKARSRWAGAVSARSKR